MSTLGRALGLITAATADAVSAFSQPAYLDRVVRAISVHAGRPLASPQEAVAIVSRQLRFTESRHAAILGRLIECGDLTAGGVMHAVTSVAQALPDADAANDLESQGLRVLEIAASL